MIAGDPQRQLAAALGRVPSGLFVLTARRGQSESGMLASWVQQCSFQPPQVSVALQRNRPLCSWLTDGSSFTLNILDDTQTDMISHFGRGFQLDEPAFDGLEVERAECRDPVLLEALGWLQCRVVGRCRAGDHELYLGEIVAGQILNQGHPMVHVRKNGLHY
jgi:flavin reductase (DIM6/NTAB) family NADH-FMN oxidoreductase RutF